MSGVPLNLALTERSVDSGAIENEQYLHPHPHSLKRAISARVEFASLECVYIRCSAWSGRRLGVVEAFL